MASMKVLSGDCMMEVLFNEDYEDNLIRESDINDSSDSKRTESKTTASRFHHIQQMHTFRTLMLCLLVDLFITDNWCYGISNHCNQMV
jgi:hypothetical protein